MTLVKPHSSSKEGSCLKNPTMKNLEIYIFSFYIFIIIIMSGELAASLLSDSTGEKVKATFEKIKDE